MRKIAKRPLWALSTSGIYILDPDADGGPAIEFFPFADGGRAKTLRLAGAPDSYASAATSASRLAVSRDERRILYEHLDRHDGDIMLVDNFR